MPALFLDVMVFWFVVRWFVFARVVHNVLIRGVMASGPSADLLIGHLVADELPGWSTQIRW